jgi:hypothetical protein
MAIYSLRLLPIGKTTQKAPYTAAAHIRYITRKGAVSHHMAERMPDQSARAMRWLRAQERSDRVDARVADKLVIALPRELTQQQQIERLYGFAEDLTKGRASWFSAIHAEGKDRNNPHAHLLVRDRDVSTGRRVVMFSAGAKEARERAAKGDTVPTSLALTRALWARHVNQALENAGSSERVDHRSLIDQGHFRRPQIHEGPNVRAMHARGARPKSQDRVVRNPALRRKGSPALRTVRYRDIDGGQSRVEYNASLKEAPELSVTEAMRRQTRTSLARPVSHGHRGRRR